MIEHKDITGIDNHIPFKWVFADEVERLALTGLVAKDLKNIAIQEDDDSMYILTAITPITQQAL